MFPQHRKASIPEQHLNCKPKLDRPLEEVEDFRDTFHKSLRNPSNITRHWNELVLTILVNDDYYHERFQWAIGYGRNDVYFSDRRFKTQFDAAADLLDELEGRAL